MYDERALELQVVGHLVVYVDYIGRRMQTNCAHVMQTEVSTDILEAARSRSIPAQAERQHEDGHPPGTRYGMGSSAPTEGSDSMQIAAWTAASRPRPALQGHRRPARKIVLIGGAGVIGSRNHPPDLPASKAGKGRGRALGRAEAARRLAAGLEVGNPPKPQRYDARHQHQLLDAAQHDLDLLVPGIRVE